MRSVANPPNRFDRHYLEWEVEPPAAELQIFEDTTKSILVKNSSPDLNFDWSLNPYRGCSHACSYCYARPDHEYLGFGAGTDFDSKIVVKTRAPELLRAALEKPTWKGSMIAFSGDTDCYQPVEAQYRLTRRCLELCYEYGNPVGIVTKSFLITRDVDLLAEMAKENLVKVMSSIAFVDDKTSRLIEPGAPRPAKRFEAMKILTDAGIPVELLLAPIIPGLNDDQIPKLLQLAKENGATGAATTLLRLPGAVSEIFLDRLRETIPLRADRVEARIREARAGALNDSRFGARMRGSGVYWDAIRTSFELTRKRLGLDRDPSRQPLKAIKKKGQISLF